MCGAPTVCTSGCRAAPTKPTFPGQLDNTVAGGQPAGLGLHENLVKECGEEASIPPELARAGEGGERRRYWNQSGQQLKPDVMTCFDLELPQDFTPRANDGEVHSFELWPVQRVFETVRDTDEFKYNCNLVLIDFFVRHGLLSADDPDFIPIVAGLRMIVHSAQRFRLSDGASPRGLRCRLGRHFEQVAALMRTSPADRRAGGGVRQSCCRWRRTAITAKAMPKVTTGTRS